MPAHICVYTAHIYHAHTYTRMQFVWAFFFASFIVNWENITPFTHQININVCEVLYRNGNWGLEGRKHIHFLSPTLSSSPVLLLLAPLSLPFLLLFLPHLSPFFFWGGRQAGDWAQALMPTLPGSCTFSLQRGVMMLKSGGIVSEGWKSETTIPKWDLVPTRKNYGVKHGTWLPQQLIRPGSSPENELQTRL